jgi:hypothetical protein
MTTEPHRQPTGSALKSDSQTGAHSQSPGAPIFAYHVLTRLIVVSASGDIAHVSGR